MCPWKRTANDWQEKRSWIENHGRKSLCWTMETRHDDQVSQRTTRTWSEKAIKARNSRSFRLVKDLKWDQKLDRKGNDWKWEKNA